MIDIYHKSITDEKLVRTERFVPGSWIFVEKPDEEELHRLADTFDLDDGLLKDGVDQYEVPRMEVDGEAIYVYTRVPHQEGGVVTTTPVLVILAPDLFMTVSAAPLPLLRKIVEKSGEVHSTQKITMLIKVFSEMVSSYNGVLTDIRKRVRGASSSIENISNKEIAQFVSFENVMNDFLSALIPTGSIISNLLSGKFFDLREEDHELVEDLFLGIGQLIELSKSTLKTTVNIREAYSTIMTNNLNRVIKILTVLTIVLTIPMMISGFFGMNVAIPFSDSPYGFWVIFTISIAISASLFYFLNKNKWL
jgi:magnesium transporter